jgi:integrase/recombinase XerD
MISDSGRQWEPGPDRFMTRQEVGTLLAKAEELMLRGKTRGRKPLVRDAMIIFCALYSGLRRFEICDLRIQDLSLGHGRSHLLVRRGKNGKGRTVHIGKEFKRVLKDYLVWKAEQGELTPESYLIRNARGERYAPTGLWRRWHKYAPNGHRLHDARHTNASLLYQATKDLRMVQQQLGHSRITTTTAYATVCPELIQDGMNQMERLAHACGKAAGRAAPAVAEPLAIPA